MASQSVKCRSFSGVIYPDSESYDYNEVLSNLCYFSEYSYILHDSDSLEDGSPKKSHIHWVGRCSGAVRISAVSSSLGISEHDIELVRNYKAMIQYLTHMNDPDKFQYDPSLIVSNIPDVLKYFRTLSEGQIVKDLAEQKLHMSWFDLVQYSVETNSYDVLRRNLGLIKLIYAEFCGDDNIAG